MLTYFNHKYFRCYLFNNVSYIHILTTKSTNTQNTQADIEIQPPIIYYKSEFIKIRTKNYAFQKRF